MNLGSMEEWPELLAISLAPYFLMLEVCLEDRVNEDFKEQISNLVTSWDGRSYLYFIKQKTVTRLLDFYHT